MSRSIAVPRRPVRIPTTLFPVLLSALALAGPVLAQGGDRPVTFTDIMQIREVEQPTISHDGRWVALTAEPDRGDPEVVVREARGEGRFSVPLATEPVISADGRWVAMRLVPSLEAVETLPEAERPRRGMAVLDTETGAVLRFEDVGSFGFDPAGRRLLYHRLPPREGDDQEADGPEGERSEAGEGGRDPGSPLVIRELGSGSERVLTGVRSWHLHPDGPWVAYTRFAAEPDTSGLHVLPLAGGDPVTVHRSPEGHYAALAWREGEGSPELAFVFAIEDREGSPGAGTLMHWRQGGAARVLVAPDEAPEGWFIPAGTELRWHDDGQAVFFGWRPMWPDEVESLARDESQDTGGPEGEEDAAPFEPYDLDAILADGGVDVWHGRDPFIMPQQKVRWPREKERTYWAVHHLDGAGTVGLSDPDLPELEVPTGSGPALARTDVPYRVERTWLGTVYDLWLVDPETGRRTLVAEGLRDAAERSPGGRFVIYWRDGAYHLYDVRNGTTRDVTSRLPVPMADEDHDYPNPPSGYGVAGWMEGDAAVLLYDKYDLWTVPTEAGQEPWSVTGQEGRSGHRVFRVVELDEDRETWSEGEALLLSSYHDLEKNFGFYRARTDRPGVERLLEEEKRFEFVARAENADQLLYTREAYDEFPDLWVAGTRLENPRRVTELNPQLSEFGWGEAELVEWQSLDGVPLQGVVIKPRGYQEGRRYPVLVYYYRFFSQRLHEFNDPSINHRPSFPVYASDGYVVFLPDVRFEVGRPGLAATKSVVPGVQHLIDMGLADPDAVALHGHSWSGYQTAFMVTQTDLFATAVAGAPVGNMTSAYSGIRLGSGLARQFQYEQGQSRMSGSLWEAPFEQSVELYLALRRLGKETVFLQYRGEPHHPQSYANKLDWAIRMKQWIDHYTKGEAAPAWITQGVPYLGR
ncbi:MAG: prolyl oligopeptidase family serine peptidase [Gemmatimonadota bacterium]